MFGCSDINETITTLQPVGVHKEGVADLASPNFHSKLFIENDWNLKECQQCHASDYSGGTAKASCLTCHNQGGGPEACNTCHGVFANNSRIAPPTDLEGNSSTTAKGVGAHAKHLYDNMIAGPVGCYECHPNNSGTEPYVYSHVGQPPADIAFGTFSTSIGTPTYDFNNYSCSNIYCHGNWEFKKDDAPAGNQFAYTDSVMVGRNYSPIWNLVDGTQAACGTCHGQVDAQNNLVSVAPTGHAPFPINACSGCHTGVVDAQGNIINKMLHINGSKNVFGN